MLAFSFLLQEYDEVEVDVEVVIRIPVGYAGWGLCSRRSVQGTAWSPQMMARSFEGVK